MKTAQALGLFCLASLVLFAAIGEVGLRLSGARPWNPEPAALSVTPGGRLYRSDARLGYAPLAGRYRVRFATGLVFGVEHDADGHRLTSAAPRAGADTEMWILGGSFTYGWAVDDHEHWPALIAEAHPSLRVVNFATPGYGTLQSLLQLEDALEKGPAPTWVVLAYAPFHDRRNTFTRSRRKRVAPFNALGPLSQPYARFDPAGGLSIRMADVSYREWPGMRFSSLIHRLEELWNRIEEARVPSGRITREIVRRIVALSRERGSEAVVATLAAGQVSREMREFAEAEGATALDLAVDLDRPGYRNLPHDAHPSARAHRAYADRLEESLAIARRGGRR